MRYYVVSLQDENGKELTNSQHPNGWHYTSHPNGVNAPPDPGALLVELDCFQGPLHLPAGDSTSTFVRVWGISLQDISQAQDLNNKTCVLYGGMGKGLPLANPKQSGLLVHGMINQAFGNWIGTAMTLDLLLVGVDNQKQAPPKAYNLTTNWQANTPMAEAVKNTLKTAYPSLKQDIKISDKLVLPNTETAYHGTIEQFAQYVYALSLKIMAPNLNLGPWASADDIAAKYAGVGIHLKGDTFKVSDDSSPPSGTKQIEFTDLIGQVTWIKPGILQATCVMRADIDIGDHVKLPDGQIAITPAAMSAYSKYRQGSIFQGEFLVQSVRHVGNYKSPDGQAWVTIIEMAILGGAV